MTEPADIVERLRNPPFRTVQTHIENVVSYTLDVDQITDDMREAAAEITRLRAALAEMKQRCAREVEERIDLWSQTENFMKSEKERDLATARRKEAQCIAAAIRGLE